MRCSICECGFIGDKRAYTCADCAYKLDTEFECGIDEPGSAEPTDYPAYKDMVLITRTDYIRMLDERAKLNALENAGVDNWIGYDEAMSTLRKNENE